MSSGPVIIPIEPLPRDIDVRITIDRPQAEVATDMSLLVFCTPNVATLPPNNGRFALASTAQGLLDATGWGPSDTGYWAIQAWAQQSPRPLRMAVGRVFQDPVPAQLMAAVITDFSALNVITDGSFAVTVTDSAGTPIVLSVEGIDLTGATNVATVVAAINAAISSGSQDSELAAMSEYGNRLVLNALGGNVTISYAEAGLSGTDVSSLLNLTQESGAQKWDAYTPSGLVSEIQLIQKAMASASAPAFVVALDREYRDTPEQKQVADYVEANLYKMAGTFCTNSPTAYDPSDTTNINKYLKNNGYRASDSVFSTYTQQYPDIAYPQPILATDYIGGRTKTAKFKSAAGITPESITESQLQVLNAYNTNVYTRVGNNSDFFREGTQGADTWFTDSYYGWANLREELQVAVLNGLMRRDKTSLDSEGQSEVVNDIGEVMQRYVENRFLGDRAIPDLTLNVPFLTKKAFTIIPSPIYNSNRATRTLSGINIDAYERGAIHSASINIAAYN